MPPQISVTAVPGTATTVKAGEAWFDLTSDCLEAEFDGQQHVRGRFTPNGGQAVATSDLHFVIVDVDVPCE